MVGWELVRYLHLLAMAFFVGGQMVLVAAVVPVMSGEENRDQLRAMARKFGIGSAVALAVLILTGSVMAGHYELWSDWKLHVKLGLVVLMIAMITWHTRRPQQHWLEGVVFLLSLAVVWLGVSLAH